MRGGELAAKYIATQFALDGLKPGGDNGTYFQHIDFFGMTVKREGYDFLARAGERCCNVVALWRGLRCE